MEGATKDISGKTCQIGLSGGQKMVLLSHPINGLYTVNQHNDIYSPKTSGNEEEIYVEDESNKPRNSSVIYLEFLCFGKMTNFIPLTGGHLTTNKILRIGKALRLYLRKKDGKREPADSNDTWDNAERIDVEDEDIYSPKTSGNEEEIYVEDENLTSPKTWDNADRNNVKDEALRLYLRKKDGKREPADSNDCRWWASFYEEVALQGKQKEILACIREFKQEFKIEDLPQIMRRIDSRFEILHDIYSPKTSGNEEEIYVEDENVTSPKTWDNADRNNVKDETWDNAERIDVEDEGGLALDSSCCLPGGWLSFLYFGKMTNYIPLTGRHLTTNDILKIGKALRLYLREKDGKREPADSNDNVNSPKTWDNAERIDVEDELNHQKEREDIAPVLRLGSIQEAVQHVAHFVEDKIHALLGKRELLDSNDNINFPKTSGNEEEIYVEDEDVNSLKTSGNEEEIYVEDVDVASSKKVDSREQIDVEN
eukprot:gene12227-2860_t